MTMLKPSDQIWDGVMRGVKFCFTGVFANYGRKQMHPEAVFDYGTLLDKGGHNKYSAAESSVDFALAKPQRIVMEYGQEARLCELLLYPPTSTSD
jgi:hypothetical protein